MLPLSETIVADNLRALLDILDRVGPKSLVVDRDLNGLLAAIAPFSVLKSHGVENVHWLDKDLAGITDKSRSVVYLTRCDPRSLQTIARQASKCSGASLKIICAGGSKQLIEWQLENESVLGDFEIFIWEAYFAQIGQNLSMFSNETGDRLICATTEALVNLQQRYGLVARISGFGPASQKIHELILDGIGERQAQATISGGFDYEFGSTFVGNTIDHLILVDRQTDWVTSLLSQLTYEGLIDDVYGIKSPGLITRDGEKTPLNDELFIQLADLNFGQVGARLNETARNLQAEVDETHNAQSVAEIKEYVQKKLDGHRKVKQNLKTHTALTEELMSRVRSPIFKNSLSLQQDLVSNQVGTGDAISRLCSLIYQGCTAAEAVRLACLVCLCRGGVREKQLHALYDEILKSYGYKYLETIIQLEKDGLLFSSGDVSFSSLARSFKLNSEEPLGEPYAGYVPLCVRLVQNLLSGADVKPIATFDTVRKSDDAREAKLRRVLLRNTPGRERVVVMVVFVGGVTYGESAAMRVLEETLNVQFVVAATDIINGEQVVSR